MKKYINYSFVYAILALISGVFFREYTKMNNFAGKTQLSFAHVHVFALGTIFIILVGLLALFSNVEEKKTFRVFWRLYNLSLPFMCVMFVVRGVLEVSGKSLSKAANSSISGIAGITHMLMAISLVMLFFGLKKAKFKGRME